MRNPEILALAQRVRYQGDPAFLGPERFKGVVKVTLNDGTMFEEVEATARHAPGPGSARGGRASLISAAQGNLRLPRRGRAW